MKEQIEQLLRKIEKKDQKLFDLLSSLEADVIVQNYGALVKYLEDMDSKQEDYTVEFTLNHTELEWNYVPKSDAAKLNIEIQNIKSNYLIPLPNSQEYLLDINEIRNAILRIFNDAKYRQELISRGLKNVERFQLATIAEQYAHIYNEVNELWVKHRYLFQ